MRVMIVDNETVIRRGLAQVMPWAQFDCEVVALANDGQDALHQMESAHPDIVLTDIRMPEMDGIELAAQIQKKHPDVAVIILSGYADFEYAQNAIRYGVVDFILKPTNIESMAEAIEKAKQYVIKQRSQELLSKTLAQRNMAAEELERKIFVQDLLGRRIRSRTAIKKRRNALHFPDAPFCLLRVQVRGKNIEAEHDESDLVTAKRIMHDVFQDMETVVVSKGDHSFLQLVFADAETAAAHSRMAVEMVDTLTDFSMYIGISEKHHELMELPIAEVEAENTQIFALYDTSENVIDMRQMPELDSQMLRSVTYDLKRLMTAIDNVESSHAQAILQELFDEMIHSGFPLAELRRISLLIYHSCSQILFRIDENSWKESWSMNVILNSDDALEIKTALQDFLRLTMEKMTGNPDDLNDIALQVVDYIQKHYKGEITLDSLASAVHLSPSYLSKMFKKQTGENISLYIQNTRIEKAKWLLTSTSKKVYEVAEDVGFSDPVYFSRIFKKTVGMKPKDYKEQIDKNNST